MAYSFTEKKRIRKDFGKRPSVLDVPYLLAIQLDSYREFLQAEKAETHARRHRPACGAEDRCSRSRAIRGNAALEYVSYRLGEPAFDERECRSRGMTYGAPLRVIVRLVIYDKDSAGAASKRDQVRQGAGSLHGRTAAHDRQRHLHRQRHRARHRLAAASFAGRVLRSRPRQDALLGQAAVPGAHHSLPRLVARLRVRSEGRAVHPHRPPPQAAGDGAAARARLQRTSRCSTSSSRRTCSISARRTASSSSWSPSACAAKR